MSRFQVLKPNVIATTLRSDPDDDIDLSDLPNDDDIDLSDIPSAEDPTSQKPVPQMQHQNPAEESMLNRLWKGFTEPLTDAPSRMAKGVADTIDNPQGEGGYMRGLGAGMLEGVGDVISGFTAPSNLLPMATGARAISTGSNAMRRITQGLSGLPAIHGGSEVIRPDATMGERTGGLAEIATSIAGMAMPGFKPKIPDGPPLPANFGPDAFSPNPDRRMGTRVPSEDAVFQEYRERLARGEDVRSPASKKLLEQKSGLDTSRKEAKIVERNGKFYEQTGVNPDTNQPTYREVKSKDPNLNQGQGDPELAGTAPINRDSTFFKKNEPKSVSSNASGESMASQEAINRQSSMKANGRKFVVYDRAGNERPLIGPEAVDYVARNGETYGVKSSDGSFTPLDNKGGKFQTTVTSKGKTETIPNGQPTPKAGAQPPNQPPVPPNTARAIDPTKEPTNPWVDAINIPRTIQSSMDFSAPLRQGLPLIHKKAWWTSLDDMVKAWGSQGAYDNIMMSIRDEPDFAIAAKSGLKLTDMLDTREESFISKTAEKIPGIKRSNRAYTGFLNKLRMDTYKSLLRDARASGMDIDNNDVALKALANFVNNASGRGSLGEAEKAADILAGLFFSPRLIASRVQMMNPKNYIMAGPQRKEYLKSMLATTGAWTTIAGLGAMAGGKVNLDMTNSDFGKIQIGNTRLDPAGGFQQYLVAANRIARGRFGSPTGKDYDLGSGYGKKTGFDVGVDFLTNKASPPARLAAEFLKASGYNPFNTTDEVVKLFLPMITQDIIELYKSEPELLPLAIPAALGMGVQTFGDSNKDTLFGYKEPFPIR